MAPDPSTSRVQAPTPAPQDKVRFLFRKDGPLRWLSHHDLLRTFERMLRRSQLPFHSSQGFNPHPRLVFALSLPVGVVGRAEIAELELADKIPPDEIHARLQAQCPVGLSLLSVRSIPLRQKAHVAAFTYGLTVPPDRREVTARRLVEAIALHQWLVQRIKPQPREVDIRPFVRDLRLDPESGWLELDLWLTPAGTARPEEVLGLVGLADLLETGTILERVRLELHEDDNPPALVGQE